MNTQVAAKAEFTLKTEKKQSFFEQLKGSIKEQLSGLKGTYSVKRIKSEDNWAARELIQKSILKRGGVGLDLLYYDKELSDLYSAYNWSDAFFGVLKLKKEVIGTVGIQPAQSHHTQGACEIKKLYVDATHQDINLREMLISFALRKGAELGYTDFLMLVDDRDPDLDRILTKKGFEVKKDKYTEMKLMTLSLTQASVLSKAS